jgi:hypothetical protein
MSAARKAAAVPHRDADDEIKSVQNCKGVMRYAPRKLKRFKTKTLDGAHASKE